MKKKFILNYNCSRDEAISKLSEWLSVRSVKHHILNGEIISSKIPIPLASWDGRQYSQDNWIGINPFLFLDKLKITVHSEKSKIATVCCSVTSYRAYVPIAFWIYVLVVTRHEIPMIPFLIVMVGLIIYCLFAYFGVMSSALRSEIKKAEIQPPTMKPKRF